MSGSMLKIDRFTGGNSFSLWKIKMEALLKSQGLWAPLTADKGGMNVASSEFKVLEEKAHATIMLCLSDDVIIEIADQKEAAKLWLKLESLYMTKSLTSKLMLKQRLFTLRMLEGTALKDHLDQLNTILLDLRNIGEKVEDEDAALLLLISLPPSYENFVQSFIVNKDDLSLEEVRSALHARELRHKGAGTGTEDHASGLMATGGSKKGKKNKKKQFSGSKLPKDVCAFCKEKGHWKRDCPKRGQQGQNGSAAVAEQGNSSEDDYVLMADVVTHSQDAWVLDSGASYHICSNRELFSTYNQTDGGSVYMANGAVCKVIGSGSVRLKTNEGKLCTLEQVRHVPLIKKNLISLSLLNSKGYNFKG